MGLTFLVLRDLSSTADKTGTAGSDKTDLLTGRGITSDSRWVTLKKSIYQSYYMRHWHTDMLMVSTTEGMFDGIHGDTTDLWPAVSLYFVFVVCATSLQEWFVDTTSSSNDADCSTAPWVKDLLCSRWKLDTGLASIGVVGDDDGWVAGCFSKDTTVADFVFNAAASSTCDQGLLTSQHRVKWGYLRAFFQLGEYFRYGEWPCYRSKQIGRL